MPAGQTRANGRPEILEDLPGELIAWRADPRRVRASRGRGPLPPGARRTRDGGAARRRVRRPGAAIGRSIATLFGSATEYRVDEDLRRLKQLLEAGETACTT